MLLLYVSEIIPKTLGAIFYKRLAIPSAYIINFFTFITKPFSFISSFLVKGFKKDNDKDITKEEILVNAQMGEEKGIIGEFEGDVIENTLNLNKCKVEDMLTPRSVVFGIEKDTKISDALKLDGIYKYSRIPIYDKVIDEVVGIVLSKDIFKKVINKETNISIEEIKREITEINENIPALKALRMFFSKKQHMFLVLDNYEQTAGVLTLEDCIETLLGVEIMDETDTNEDLQKFAKKNSKIEKPEASNA